MLRTPVNAPTIPTATKTAIGNAFNNVLPLLRNLVPIYIQATPEKKAELRLHNPTLNKFINMLESCGVYI